MTPPGVSARTLQPGWRLGAERALHAGYMPVEVSCFHCFELLSLKPFRTPPESRETRGMGVGVEVGVGELPISEVALGSLGGTVGARTHARTPRECHQVHFQGTW